MNCKECNKTVKNKKNKFCSHSCAATFNNRGKRRHGSISLNRNCFNCQKEIYGNKFCSKNCYDDFRYKNNLINNSFGVSSGKSFLIKKFGNKCMKCGWCEINLTSKKVPIELNHKDGNYKNNNINNLELLCPNCHSLTPNYKGLNKGNGREYRRKNNTDLAQR